MKKKESVLSFFFESYNKCFTSEIFFRFGQIVFNLACTSRKKFCSCVVCLFVCFFLKSLLIIYLITLSLEKEIIILEKV